MSYPKNRWLRVGSHEFFVAESGKFRWAADWVMTQWDEESAEEWRSNLTALNKMPPGCSDDARRLRDAERWMDRKGGDA
ncbi:hypothetical protein VN12_10575 [Pirellula sp. SH-Sr6A]|uniref:hypothetical protein n=1 Tax=Pirellula sp. SH-Sr6A TaxID=1632865 RepID=UPI00078B87E1|nr:hypothetical protein [Pirellula sp. SH-Sr6A]AMV32560.1 hypothetical protein VN12_10575 [Pirellula sp. SH-Sr6A]